MANHQLDLESKVKSRRKNLQGKSGEDSSPRAPRETSHARGARKNEREILKELIQSPATKYVATGVATALLTYLAKRLTDHYPEISDFIQENLDMLEGRMGQYQTAFHGNESHTHKTQ